MPKTIYSYNKRICVNCQEEYSNRKNKKFCSLNCYEEFRKKKPIIIRNCVNCKKEFTVKIPSHKNKFCSRSCSAKFSNNKNKNNTRSKESRLKSSLSMRAYHRSDEIYGVYRLKKLFKDVVMKRQHPDILGEYSTFFIPKCHHCNNFFISKSVKKYCKEHEHLYDRYYQQKYSFNKLNVYKYPDLFDTELLDKLGWYNPTENPNGMARDHKVSINESVKNNYDPYYITHPLNCELITQRDNNRKNSNSSITYEQLVKEVNAYDQKSELNSEIRPA